MCGWVGRGSGEVAYSGLCAVEIGRQVLVLCFVGEGFLDLTEIEVGFAGAAAVGKGLCVCDGLFDKNSQTVGVAAFFNACAEILGLQLDFFSLWSA